MSGFKVGDRVRAIGNTIIGHHYNIGDELTVEKFYDTERYGVRGSSDEAPLQIIYIDDLELIEECVKMAHNNGDLIKVQVDRDNYGAPVYDLFVKFGEFYYNLSTDKQMRGCKSLPSGSKHWIGTMGGTGDHMLAAIEGKDQPEEVADDGIPFDSKVVGISGHGKPTIWIDDIETPTPLTVTEIEKRNQQALKALEKFNKAFTGSGLMTTDQLSDVEYSEKIKADKYL